MSHSSRPRDLRNADETWTTALERRDRPQTDAPTQTLQNLDDVNNKRTEHGALSSALHLQSERRVPRLPRRSARDNKRRATEQTLFTDRAYAKRTNQPPDVMAPCLVGMFSASPPRQKSLENSRKSKGASLRAIDPVPRWSGARRRPERGAPIVAKISLCDNSA